MPDHQLGGGRDIFAAIPPAGSSFCCPDEYDGGYEPDDPSDNVVPEFVITHNMLWFVFCCGEKQSRKPTKVIKILFFLFCSLSKEKKKEVKEDFLSLPFVLKGY